MSIRRKHILAHRLRAVAIFVALLLVLEFIWSFLANRKRTSGHYATNASTMRQIGSALQLYSFDWDDRLPVAEAWMDGTYPYINSYGVFGAVQTYLAPKPDEPKTGRYGRAFLQPLSSTNFAKVTEPGNQVVVFNSTRLGWNANDKFVNVPSPGYDAGGNYYLFLDAHVKRFAPTDSTCPDKFGKLPISN